MNILKHIHRHGRYLGKARLSRILGDRKWAVLYLAAASDTRRILAAQLLAERWRKEFAALDKQTHAA
ncbi:MAG: hypothetical protein FVQ81_13195 [Candidatus Glassbacteria bacterium]|nr:hypothetical protein [Candidatus Glassbacteria bacterium]